MLEEKSAVESTRNYGESRILDLLPLFLKHAQYELNFAPKTVLKYEECLKTISRHVGNLEVSKISQEHVLELKAIMVQRGAGESRLAQLVFSLKSFLKYVAEDLQKPTLDYKKIKSPKRPRREVIFLTNEEIAQFIEAIHVQTKEKKLSMNSLRFRTLVEVLLGSGMRISEVLSLNRDSIDFENAEAKIIGKGNKERVVFFNPRSLEWIQYYLSHRKDSNPALFVSVSSQRVRVEDISKLFRTYRKKAGIEKKLTPHILRHTLATNLLFNGCPISHVKEILGHSDLQTTCKYYLGVDKRKAKEAHQQYLNYQ